MKRLIGYLAIAWAASLAAPAHRAAAADIDAPMQIAPLEISLPPAVPASAGPVQGHTRGDAPDGQPCAGLRFPAHGNAYPTLHGEGLSSEPYHTWTGYQAQ